MAGLRLDGSTRFSTGPGRVEERCGRQTDALQPVADGLKDYLARGRFARQGRAGLRGRGAVAPGDGRRLRRPQFLRNAADLRAVPCQRLGTL